MSVSSPAAQYSDARESPASPPIEVKTAPPPGRPRREGNESLWKRARRTLGTSSLTFLQPQSRPPPGTRSENDSTTGTGPAAPSKRREQVRHAQRTHRQRTQNYIKTLESEVVRLRGSETDLIQERDKLQLQINTLKTTIILSNLPLPPEIDHFPTADAQIVGSQDPEMATVSYRTDELNHQRLHVNWTPTANQEFSQMSYNLAQRPAPLTTSQPYHDPLVGENFPNLPDDFSLQPLNFDAALDKIDSAQSLVKSLDSPEVAIEFVLALEHPCMTHIQHPLDSHLSDPSGHVHMASAPLFSNAPRQPKPNTTWNWTANGSVIKELLNLSASINLEGEITPVEAWHRLRQHPNFWRLDLQGVENLKNELSMMVRCCGFGAVLDEQEFEGALDKHLGNG